MFTNKQIIAIALAVPIGGFVLMCGLCGGLAAIAPPPELQPLQQPAATQIAEPPPATPQPRQPWAIEAWVMAQDFVKQGLKSPSTASFGSVWSEYQKPDKCVTALDGDRYRVVGWVDSQNAFGATIRNRFALTLQYLGNDQWQCVEGPLFSEL